MGRCYACCHGDRYSRGPCSCSCHSSEERQQRGGRKKEKMAVKKLDTPPAEEFTPEFKQRVADAVVSFKPGLYQHYKGNAYVALCLVTHHEARLPMVLYISLVYGSTNVRPLIGWPGDEDGFIDEVTRGMSTFTTPRFKYVGTLPSDVPALKRF